jgi:hypothetical protein
MESSVASRVHMLNNGLGDVFSMAFMGSF